MQYISAKYVYPGNCTASVSIIFCKGAAAQMGRRSLVFLYFLYPASAEKLVQLLENCQMSI